MRKKFQYKVVDSRLTLPIVVIIGLLLWLLSWRNGQLNIPSFILFAISSTAMMMMNHAYALIRVYSRMIACSYIVLTTALTIPTQLTGFSVDSVLVQLCFVLITYIAFSCYQERKSQGVLFYAFILLGLASFFFPQALYFLPLFWLLLGSCLMTFSLKVMISSVLGVLFPYIYAGIYLAVTGNTDKMLEHIKKIVEFSQIADFSIVTPEAIQMYIFLSVITLIGIINFLSVSHYDKVRTRQMYYYFIVLSVFTSVFLVLQPQHIYMLIGVQIIPTSALIGHYFSLTRTRFSSYVFNTIILLCFFISVNNIFHFVHLWNF